MFRRAGDDQREVDAIAIHRRDEVALREVQETAIDAARLQKEMRVRVGNERVRSHADLGAVACPSSAGYAYRTVPNEVRYSPRGRSGARPIAAAVSPRNLRMLPPRISSFQERGISSRSSFKRLTAGWC